MMRSVFISFILFGVAFTTIFNGRATNETKRINIVFIGNSITEGKYLKNPPPVTAVEYLRSMGCEVDYSNCGISGFTTVNFLPNPENLAFSKVITAADKLNSGKTLLVFSIMLGTNDSAISGPAGAPVSSDNYKRNIQTIADSIFKRYPECKIVLNYPIWYSPTTHNSARYLQDGLDRLQTYFPRIEELAKENTDKIFVGDTEGFTFFERYYLKYHNPQEGNSGTFYLHPNQEGAVKLGEFWAEKIYRLFFSNTP